MIQYGTYTEIKIKVMHQNVDKRNVLSCCTTWLACHISDSTVMWHCIWLQKWGAQPLALYNGWAQPPPPISQYLGHCVLINELSIVLQWLHYLLLMYILLIRYVGTLWSPFYEEKILWSLWKSSILQEYLMQTILFKLVYIIFKTDTGPGTSECT